MEQEARTRLKVAIAQSGKKAKTISIHNGWPPTYVSRLISGDIQKPGPERLLKICDDIGTTVAFILKGRTTDTQREQLLRQLSGAPDEVIKRLADFIEKKGLKSG